MSMAHGERTRVPGGISPAGTPQIGISRTCGGSVPDATSPPCGRHHAYADADRGSAWKRAATSHQRGTRSAVGHDGAHIAPAPTEVVCRGDSDVHT
jgi:hypothetical protein